MKFQKLTLLIILFCSIHILASAQQKDSIAITGEKLFFVGIQATTMGYNLEYKPQLRSGHINTYGNVYIGYRWSKRARVSAGLSYGTNKYNFETVFVESEDKLIYRNEISNTKGVSMPLVLDYRLFYPFRRLQVYGTAMITPIISTTHLKKTERIDGETTVTYDAQATGLNTYLTAGFGLNYAIGQRIEIYGNYYMISRSFNKGLRPRDEYPYPGSLAVGLNYNLNLHRSGK